MPKSFCVVATFAKCSLASVLDDKCFYQDHKIYVLLENELGLLGSSCRYLLVSNYTVIGLNIFKQKNFACKLIFSMVLLD